MKRIIGRGVVRLTIAAAAALTVAVPASETSAVFAQAKMPPQVITEKDDDRPNIKILLIGQSIFMTNNAAHVLHVLCKAKRPRDSFLIEMVAQGGYSLKDHYDSGVTMREIKRERWNYIVIQESTMNQIVIHQPYEQYAPVFDAEARKVGAKPFQFEGYDDSMDDNSKNRMYLEAAKVAKAVKEPLIPVGSAWRYVTKYYPKFQIFGPDYHHPSVLGSYLIACLMYSKIFNEPTDGVQLQLIYTDPRSRRDVTLDSTHDESMRAMQTASWLVVKNMPQ